MTFAAVDKSMQSTELKKIVFDNQATITERWKALMKLSVSKGRASLPDLEQALNSKDWFLRDGALRATCAIDESLGKKWARYLLSDPALVVRTTAVDMIRRLNDLDAKENLWSELNQKRNFRFGNSLWVRKHIVAVLLQFDPEMKDERFATLLDDKDLAIKSILKHRE